VRHLLPSNLRVAIYLFAISTTVPALAQVSTVFINPLQGGWPARCSDLPANTSSNCMVQGFGRAVDDTIFHVDSGWFPPYDGYHLAYDVKVEYSAQDLATQNYRKEFAPASGQVKYAGIVLGYTVVIQFNLLPGDPDGPSVCGVFYHMLEPEDGGITLAVGQLVTQGETIGFVSPFEKDFGEGSAPHQHFGIRKGAYVAGIDTSTPTGFWHYPGYTTVCLEAPYSAECQYDSVTGAVVREDDRTDPRHGQVISEWFNPDDFLIRHSAPNPTITSITTTAPLLGYYPCQAAVQSVGFSFIVSQSLTNVSISAAAFSSTYLGPTTGMVFLTNKVGPGTTSSNIITTRDASTLPPDTFSSTQSVQPIFAGLNLSAGSYYVVFVGTSGSVDVWLTNAPVTFDSEAASVGDDEGDLQYSHSFPPASSFTSFSPNIVFTVTGNGE
jgi:murein DD-endopeptidase MepM/ murein hydrolase activator NlpD